jgi:hypothetical protein
VKAGPDAIPGDGVAADPEIPGDPTIGLAQVQMGDPAWLTMGDPAWLSFPTPVAQYRVAADTHHQIHGVVGLYVNPPTDAVMLSLDGNPYSGSESDPAAAAPAPWLAGATDARLQAQWADQPCMRPGKSPAARSSASAATGIRAPTS